MTKRPILSGILGGATLSTLPVVLQEMTPSNLVIFVLNPLQVPGVFPAVPCHEGRGCTAQADHQGALSKS